MRHLLALALVSLSGCGSEGTAADTRILLANVEDSDIPADVRSTLGATEESEHEVRFPDGDGVLRFVVSHARAQNDGRYLRTIAVVVVSSGGYELSAEVISAPTNAGTVESPVHTRLVQITRQKSGLTGTTMGQMTVRVAPESALAI
jgi:hypothetical protein